MLNRTAIILRYQEPFVRWINEADPVVEEPNIDIEPDECTAAQSTSIRKTSLRNCDTSVVKDETALPAARARFAKSSVPETEPCRSSPAVVAAMTARFPATTWAKLVRQRGWRRPRRRVYPAKPKTGIRATHPNEYWHIDVTVIRLLDDTKCYLHSLESFTQFEQLIDFYVNEHNTRMPHNAFGRQTPDEVYFDQADRLRERLTTARHQARRSRMEANRGESCRACTRPAQQTMSAITAVANAPP